MPEESEKASLLLRFIAKGIDFIVIAAAIRLVPQVGYLAGVLYVAISDGLFDGRSLGKKVVRLRVVQPATGGPADFRASVLRNAVFALAVLIYAIPFFGLVIASVLIALEILLVIGNKDGLRLGDELAGTKVIEG